MKIQFQNSILDCDKVESNPSVYLLLQTHHYGTKGRMHGNNGTMGVFLRHPVVTKYNIQTTSSQRTC